MAIDVVTVGVRLVELVMGGVAMVGLAAVCAAACSAHVKGTNTATNARHAVQKGILQARPWE